MSGNVDNHGDEWPECVFNATTIRLIDKVEKVGSKAHCVYAHVTEHDYLGLSTTSLSPQASATQNTQALFPTANMYAKDEEFESGDTELRLGIGPHCNGDANSETHVASSVQSVSHQQADAGSVTHGNVSVNTAMEVERSIWPWIVSGRFRIPVPKVSIGPAKRPYMEIGNESGDDKASARTLSTNSGTSPETVSQPQSSMVVSSLQGGLYTWGHSSGSAWQHACDAGASYAHSNRSLPPSQVFKVPPSPPICQYSPQPPSTLASSVALLPSSASDGRASLTCRNCEEDTRMSKAPVVGWPPVRSFRKNNLHSTVPPGASKAGSASSDVEKHKDANSNTLEAVGEQNKGSKKETLFVKAKLDGVRICRKVDLTCYDNYDSLKTALQEMFQGFLCNDNAKLDLLQGKNYVLTHEDKDGDWMLVGDVPWHMFVTTVKSFRIMKAVDAVGLGEKMFAKLRAHQDIA